MGTTEYQGVRISMLGHASALLEAGGKRVLIDPFKLNTVSTEPADLSRGHGAGGWAGGHADVVFVTHEHYDHCSIEDLQQACGKDTIVVTVVGCQSKLMQNIDAKTFLVVAPGDSGKVADTGIGFEAVAAYNTNKQFHPRENEWAGFVVTINGVRVYHAGDTDLISEMGSVQCDVALLPVSGTYVMTAEEAARAAGVVGCKLAIPMHYGGIVGTIADAQRFIALLPQGVAGRILE
ncbi:hypothetical protein AUJ68_02255 [Candidatus Woesearchaeota archaeon CG1_02_57_44]|nr:MAG: hypothetical protein AUJ68_02255 [Candidatus Woesearchaeota archaeon CG1_02_57_44]PIN67559.1 MAG: Zn-dependent hydrolase [Candidatus Woesearchaeota archaeon CG11_big_fil_rev_8_21_14_0_20_57_5]